MGEFAGRRLTASYPLLLTEDASGVHLSLARWPEPELCELTETLSAGGDAEAERLTFEETQWHGGGGMIRVHDSLGDKNGEVGDRLWVIFSRKSGRWEVVQLEC